MTEARNPSFGLVHRASPGDEVEALLALYAARRLAPRYGAMPRIRAAVFDRIGSGGPFAITRGAARRGRVARRLVAAGVAASLSVATAATVVTAGPSSPLYGARLWIEELTLPGAAGVRSDAHRQRLEARLAEAEAAAASGDGSAVAQALAAYQAEVAAALEDVGDDETQLIQLEAALATHLVVLDALVDRAPPQAADAISHARSASDQAVDKLKEKNDKKDKARPTNEPAGPREDR